MSSSATITRLFCIVIDDNLQVRDSSFFITVPSNECLDLVITTVMSATPSLSRVDRSKFRLYKPPPELPITCNSSSLNGCQLTEKHISKHLSLPLRVWEAFPEKDDTRRFDIDVIVRVSSLVAEDGSFEDPEPKDIFISCATINLKSYREHQLPPHRTLKLNDIASSDIPNKIPNIFWQFEEKLDHPRSTSKCSGAAGLLLDSLKMYIGDEAFHKHFTDSNSGSEMGFVSPVEILHYLDIFLNDDLSSLGAYQEKSESHISKLLSKFAVLVASKNNTKMSFGTGWPFCLAIKITKEDPLYKYSPRSDFFVTVNDFPHLLLEVSSDGNSRDCNRMLLQAACLARLGNTLMADESSTFFVKAIYVDRDYRATEYTLCHERGSLKKVVYVTNSYKFIDKRKMFTLIFRLYNFFHSMQALNEKISAGLDSVKSSLRDKMNICPSVSSSTKRGPEDSDYTSGPSKRKGQQSRD